MLSSLLKVIIFVILFCSFSNAKKKIIPSSSNLVNEECNEAECEYICKAMKCLNLDVKATNTAGVYNNRTLTVDCKVPLSCYGNVHIHAQKRSSKSIGRLNCESKACRDGEFVFENLWKAKVEGPVQESLLNFKRVMNVDIKAVEGSHKDRLTLGTGWSRNTIYAADVHTFKLEAVNGAADASVFQLGGVKEFDDMPLFSDEHPTMTRDISNYIKAPTTKSTEAKIDITCRGPDSCSGSFFFVSKCSPPMTLRCTQDACGFVTIMVMKNYEHNGQSTDCGTKDTFKLKIEVLPDGQQPAIRNKLWIYFEDEATWRRHQSGALALKTISPRPWWQTGQSYVSPPADTFTIMGPDNQGKRKNDYRTERNQDKRGYYGCEGLKRMGKRINKLLKRANNQMMEKFPDSPVDRQTVSKLLSIPDSAWIGLSFEGSMMSIFQAAITHPLTTWQREISAANYLSGFALQGPATVATGAVVPAAVIPLIIVGIYLTVTGIQELVLWIRRSVRDQRARARENEITGCFTGQSNGGALARQEMINLYGDVMENDEYGQRVRDYQFDEDGRIIEYDMFNNGQAVTRQTKYNAVQLVYNNEYNNEKYVGTNGQQSVGYEYNPRYYEVNANGYDYDEIGGNGNYYEPYSNGNALNALMILLPVVGFCCTFFLLCSILACCIGGLACFKDKIVGFVDGKNRVRHYDEVSDAV